MLAALPYALLACAPAPLEYPVTGRVIEVRSASEVVIAHDDIPGFMAAMTMPFTVADPALLAGVDPGDGVAGTLVVDAGSTRLVRLVVTTEAPPPEEPPALAPGQSVPEGAIFPSTPIVLAEGAPVTLGQGQQGRWILTFVYTRCPIPEFCPAVVTRLQALQDQLPPDTRILAVTLDPAWDSRGVLRDFGRSVGAIPGRWDFGRVPEEVLVGLAEKAGLQVHGGRGADITHDLVFLVLDADGRLLKRYRDLGWDSRELLATLPSR